MFNCKTQHSMCKALCCGTFPIDEEIYDRNKFRIVTEPYREVRFTENNNKSFVTAHTESGLCVFLNKDLSCNIYDQRPLICKKYGDESHALLRCPFQDKNGTVRSRQERRSVLQNAEKKTLKIKTKMYEENKEMIDSAIRESEKGNNK